MNTSEIRFVVLDLDGEDYSVLLRTRTQAIDFWAENFPQTGEIWMTDQYGHRIKKI